MSKIFCIGLNKTGTTSLHKAFQYLGYKSVHFRDEKGNNIKSIIQDNYLNENSILTGLESYDVILDWMKGIRPIDVVKKFDQEYPGSKFIFTQRDIESWITSRENHVKKELESTKKVPDKNDNWLSINKDAWRKEYYSYIKDVEEYFKDRDDLLYINIIEGEGWNELCSFLNKDVPNISFPLKNVFNG